MTNGRSSREESNFLSGADLRWFEHTAEPLRVRKYPFKPARQVDVPKPGKPEETRPLTMISPRDRILREAIRGVLKKAYTNQHFRRTRTGSD